MTYSINKLFDPENYIVNNPSLYGLLPEQSSITGNAPLFYLMTDNSLFNEDFGGFINSQQIPDAEKQKLIMGFPYIPSQINFSYATNYGLTSRALGVTEDLQFLSNNAERVTISDVILSTRSSGRTFLPLIQKLQYLMTNQIQPSFFYICIQDRILYPYVLNNMDVIETGWSSGLPVEGKVSFEFIRSAWGNGTLNKVASYKGSPKPSISDTAYTELDEDLQSIRTLEDADALGLVEDKVKTKRFTLPTIIDDQEEFGIDIPTEITGDILENLPLPRAVRDLVPFPLSFEGAKKVITNSGIINARNKYNEIFR